MTLASVSLPSVKHVSHRTDTFERTQDASVNLNDFDLAGEILQTDSLVRS